MNKYIHRPTGNIGTFVKEYIPTGRGLTMMIRLDDGRYYYAPKVEFDIYKGRNPLKSGGFIDLNNDNNKSELIIREDQDIKSLNLKGGVEFPKLSEDILKSLRELKTEIVHTPIRDKSTSYLRTKL